MAETVTIKEIEKLPVLKRCEESMEEGEVEEILEYSLIKYSTEEINQLRKEDRIKNAGVIKEEVWDDLILDGNIYLHFDWGNYYYALPNDEALKISLKEQNQEIFQRLLHM